MKKKKLKNDSSSDKTIKKLELTGEISIECINATKERILHGFSEGDSIVIDLSNIEWADLSLIQLLYAAKKEADLKNKELYLMGRMRKEIEDLFSTCGFLPLINSIQE